MRRALGTRERERETAGGEPGRPATAILSSSPDIELCWLVTKSPRGQLLLLLLLLPLNPLSPTLKKSSFRAQGTFGETTGGGRRSGIIREGRREGGSFVRSPRETDVEVTAVEAGEKDFFVLCERKRERAVVVVNKCSPFSFLFSSLCAFGPHKHTRALLFFLSCGGESHCVSGVAREGKGEEEFDF